MHRIISFDPRLHVVGFLLIGNTVFWFVKLFFTIFINATKVLKIQFCKNNGYGKSKSMHLVLLFPYQFHFYSNSAFHPRSYTKKCDKKSEHKISTIVWKTKGWPFEISTRNTDCKTLTAKISIIVHKNSMQQKINDFLFVCLQMLLK